MMPVDLDESTPSSAGSWSIDRRIPLALLVALVVQTFGALMWAGRASERIDHIEQKAARVQDLAERAARLEVHVTQLQGTLARIETKLDRLTPQPATTKP